MEILGINQILAQLPHRYPFLMVDRVIKIEEGKSLIAVKNVTINEPFFQGHFPCRPVMPGVLIIEALAQAAGLLAISIAGTPEDGNLFYLVAVDNARFKQPVVPGDQLHLEIGFVKAMRGVWKFTAQAKVDGNLVASADLMCALREAKS